MFVEVDVGHPDSPAQLVEPRDFKAFKLVVRGPKDTALLEGALGELGRVASGGTHAWLGVNGVRRLAAELSDDTDWNEKFDGMVSYAGSKGWLSSEGDEMRAHIEWA